MSFASRDTSLVRFLRPTLGRDRETDEFRHDPITREEALETVVEGVLRRALKYARRGFDLINVNSGTRVPLLPPRAKAFDAMVQTLPRLDRLIVSVFEKQRSGRWPLYDLVQYMLSPLVLPIEVPDWSASDMSNPTTRLVTVGPSSSPFRAITSDEVAASIDRLLRGGLLVGFPLHPAEGPRFAPDDGFPLLETSKYALASMRRERELTPQQIAFVRDLEYGHAVPEEMLPEQIDELPDLVRRNLMEGFVSGW